MKKKAVIFEKGVLLMTCIGEIGKLGITNERCSSNQQITALIPSKELDVEYLYYSMKYLKPLLNTMANNAVVPILNNQNLYKIQIPLPPLATQQRIATILDAADALRKKTQQIIDSYDELAQSIFLDMFGDPVKNPKHWDNKTVDEICLNICGGGTPSKSKPEYFLGTIPWVTPKDMKSLEIKDTIDHITEIAIKDSSTNLIKSGAILMVIRSGILKHTLPVAINLIDVTINQDMKAFFSKFRKSCSIILTVFFH